MIKNEVIPVVGELAKPETYQEALDKSTFVIDNVIDFTAQEPFNSKKNPVGRHRQIRSCPSSYQDLYLHLTHPRLYPLRGGSG